MSVLDEHAPVKQKTIRANHAPYMTKALRKAIMKRSELRTKYYKNPTDFNLQKFKKHRNFCSKLYKKERKKYYNNLDLKNIEDNKKFWKTVKPFASDKFTKSSKISLLDNGTVVSDDSEIANIFKNFFKNAVTSLNLKCDETLISDTSNLDDPVDIAIEKFKNHPSINLIRENVGHDHTFDFGEVSNEDLKKEIQNLDQNKSTTHKGIPAKALKLALDESNEFLVKVWNEEVLVSSFFPNALKLADVTPVFKKDDKLQAKNYRPVSVLALTVSKLFERVMQKQIRFQVLLIPFYHPF